MSRSARLFDLLQALRRRRRPVTAQALAGELGVSIRTMYRDIATLQGQGADIRGEAGLGYVLTPGFMLPPLMFSADEIEALVLGSRWVAGRGDARLSAAARDALAKVAAVLPDELRRGFRHFRADRIISLAPTDERYPRRRQALLGEWRAKEKSSCKPNRDGCCQELTETWRILLKPTAEMFHAQPEFCPALCR